MYYMLVVLIGLSVTSMRYFLAYLLHGCSTSWPTHYKTETLTDVSIACLYVVLLGLSLIRMKHFLASLAHGCRTFWPGYYKHVVLLGRSTAWKCTSWPSLTIMLHFLSCLSMVVLLLRQSTYNSVLPLGLHITCVYYFLD